MPNVISLNVSTKKASKDDLDKIPISKAFNYDDLTKDNDDKIEVIAEIPVSTSKRNWDYEEGALKDVVKDVNDGKVVGFKGHQKPENISTEFPDIKTFWLGAVYDDVGKKAIIRGLQDKHDTKLNYLIKNGIIDTVSIFGKPKIKKENGRTKVIGYDTMSIDWTPRNRAGMPTSIKVASGEMQVLNDSFAGELDGSFEETSNEVMMAVRAYFGINENNNKYAWSRKTFPTYAIVDIEDGNNNKRGLYKVNFESNNDTILITSSEEVKLVESYVSISGEQSNEEVNINMGENNNNNNNNANTNLSSEYLQVIGEMSAVDLKNILTEYNTLKENEKNRLHGEMVAECINEKIENEKVKKVVLELANFKGTTKELINGEIDELLKKDVIKSMLNTEYKSMDEKPNNNNNSNSMFKGLKKA